MASLRSRPAFLVSLVVAVLLPACGSDDDALTDPVVPAPSVCVSAVSTAPAPMVVAAPGLPTGLAVATSLRFAGSGTCGTCHRTDTATVPPTNVDPVTGDAVGIPNDWAGTMMANAARDPYYLATVTAEMGAVPNYSAAIQAKCLTCHAPMASYEARLAGTVFGLKEMYASELGLDGVSCLLCHRIEAINLGTDASFSGGFVIGDQAGVARPVYGPFTDVATMPMVNLVAFTPVHSAHLLESALCAACHTLRTEAVDPVSQQFSGVIFPEQMPYKEWLSSSHVTTASCQSCHVPLTPGSVRLSSIGPTRGQAPFGKHHFVGGNAFMLGLMRQDRLAANTLNLVADAGNFDAAIARTENGLSRATAMLGAQAEKLGLPPPPAGVMVEVPAGSTYARFSLFDADVAPGSDVDLYVFGPTGAFIAGSGNGGSNEEVNILNPAAGTYYVFMHGWGLPTGTSPFKLHAWALGSTAAGNMTVTAPASATIGTSGTINLTFSGLAAGTKYLGSVAYSGASGMPNPTIVRVDTP